MKFRACLAIVNTSEPASFRRITRVLSAGLTSRVVACAGRPLGAPAEYAKVLRMLGNGRLEAYCFDGQTRQAHIRGKMRKKVWVGAGDIILISLRDFQDGKAGALGCEQAVMLMVAG